MLGDRKSAKSLNYEELSVCRLFEWPHRNVVYTCICTGGLSVVVTGPTKTHIDLKDNGDETFTATYVPKVGGEYTIRILCGDRDIKGSPFTCKVAGQGKCLTSACC